MNLFHIIDDGAAILRVKGSIYKQAKIFQHGVHVYAEVTGGYIRLLKGGRTSNPVTSWLEVEGPNVVVKDDTPTYVEPKKPGPVVVEIPGPIPEVRRAS